MSRIRSRVVFILLILILLVASALFGLLTYWLDSDLSQVSSLREENEMPLCSETTFEKESLSDGPGEP